MAVNLLPGYGYVDDSGFSATGQYLLPGYGYVWFEAAGGGVVIPVLTQNMRGGFDLIRGGFING